MRWWTDAPLWPNERVIKEASGQSIPRSFELVCSSLAIALGPRPCRSMIGAIVLVNYWDGTPLLPRHELLETCRRDNAGATQKGLLVPHENIEMPL